MNINVYVVYDYEGVNENPVYGVFTDLDEALKACKEIAKTITEECFSTDPKESGLDREYDEKAVYNSCLRSLAIQVLPYGFNRIAYESKIIIPELKLKEN